MVEYLQFTIQQHPHNKIMPWQPGLGIIIANKAIQLQAWPRGDLGLSVTEIIC